MNQSDHLSTRQIAERIGVSAQRVLQMARERSIEPCTRIGPAFIWHAADLKRFNRRPAGRPRSHT
jgi:transcriptional regulator with XRE-family HTH domain